MNSANLDVVLKNYHTPIDVYEESEEEWIPYAVVDYDRSYEIKSGEQRVRKSFRETIAFLPNLKTDSNGEVNVPFIASDLLSTFRVLAFANTKDLLFKQCRHSFCFAERCYGPDKYSTILEGGRYNIYNKHFN
jgi:hypothetical protein